MTGSDTLRRAMGRFIRPPIALVATIALTSCSSLLEVEVPALVEADTVNDPTQAALLVDGVVSSFECAFGSYVIAGGLMSDELADSQTNALIYGYDRRDIGPGDTGIHIYGTADCLNANSTGLGVYIPVARARWYADDVTRKLEGWTDAQVPSRGLLTATTAAYAGYGLVLLGESMCTAAIDLGPELSKAQIFTEADARFTKAMTLAQAAGSADLLNMARVGKARALLNLGRKPDAATVARTVVPVGFTFGASAANTPGRQNRPFIWNNLNLLATVQEPYRDMTFGGVADPRVPVQNANRNGADAATALWVQRKYLAETISTPLATWEEAQLIIAEAVLGTEAVGIINALHTRVGLPAFSSTDNAAIQNQVIEERRRELFLESHRFFDISRYNLPLVPTPGTAFGKGGNYGSTRCLLLPDRERQNNPNIS